MESLAADLRQMQRTPLAAAHVEALRKVGRVVAFPAGAYLARPGEPADRFRYLLSGEVEVVDVYTGERRIPTTLGPAQFLGEITLLDGGVWSMALRAAQDTEVIEVARDDLLTLMARVPELSESSSRCWPRAAVASSTTATAPCG